MEIIKNETGKCSISYKALVEIAEIACHDVKDIEVNTKEEYVVCNLSKTNELTVDVSVKVKKGSDIIKTCKALQDTIKDSYELMTGIEVKQVNININGFVK